MNKEYITKDSGKINQRGQSMAEYHESNEIFFNLVKKGKLSVNDSLFDQFDSDVPIDSYKSSTALGRWKERIPKVTETVLWRRELPNEVACRHLQSALAFSKIADRLKRNTPELYDKFINLFPGKEK